ncbi:AMP-binding protein [Streptomyces cyaneofuscatus]|uniref:class I adenylate-forming enzyme family protein n=1 Tax=Streptomyces cyaneofuscatus TaxID=66883 RepID=UPI0038651949|nr:AMP-binding protein [Streptomyces cyaneofuscatus]
MSLARTSPERPALSVESADGTWTHYTVGELYERVAATAAYALAADPPGGDHTLVALPNGEGLVRAVLASWMLGRTPMLTPPEATDPEKRVLSMGLGRKTQEAFIWSESTLAAALEPDAPQPHFTPRGQEPPVTWYLPTGGSTGLPSLFPVSPRPATVLTGARRLMKRTGWSPEAVQLSLGPLSHTAPLTMCMAGITGGAHVVMLRRLDPASLESTVNRFAPTWCQLTPHQMSLIDAHKGLWDALSRSLIGMLHTSAPCPDEVKRRWISRLGAQRVHETYSSTQAVGATLCDGDEWLAHPGTVGRPFLSNQVLIADEEGRSLPPGDVGEVCMRSEWTDLFAGEDVRRVRSGGDDFLGVGDLGYTDSDGYLYLTGRLDDIILVGGANVSAREVENVLLAHPDVLEVVVVKRLDPLMGHVIHAVMVPSDLASPPGIEGLRRHCLRSLSPYKVPWAVDWVENLPRSHAGKVERFLRG